MHDCFGSSYLLTKFGQGVFLHPFVGSVLIHVLVSVIREVCDIYDNSRNGTLHNGLNNTPEMCMGDAE